MNEFQEFPLAILLYHIWTLTAIRVCYTMCFIGTTPKEKRVKRQVKLFISETVQILDIVQAPHGNMCAMPFLLLHMAGEILVLYHSIIQ